jgi:hypothetical protein
LPHLNLFTCTKSLFPNKTTITGTGCKLMFWVNTIQVMTSILLYFSPYIVLLQIISHMSIYCLMFLLALDSYYVEQLPLKISSKSTLGTGLFPTEWTLSQIVISEWGFSTELRVVQPVIVLCEWGSLKATNLFWPLQWLDRVVNCHRYFVCNTAVF